MKNRAHRAELAWVGLILSFLVLPKVCGVTFDDPDNFGVKRTWSGSSLNIPGNLGGMLFTETGETVYVVGNSEAYNSALYAVPLTRDPVTNEVTDMGPADQVTVAFGGDPNTAGLDAGCEIGPEGTLFYTYWDANRLGQRPGGVSGTETLFNMADVGLPNSVAGLTFSPYLTDPNTGFGMMQVSVWYGDDLYNVRLSPLGEGLFEPQQIEPFVTLPQQGTGAIQYVPSGPFTGNMMYVNWDYGEIWILMIDEATGLPIDDATGLPTLGTDNPRVQRFASGLGVGPWGLEFDPLTNDFFVSTWQGNPYNSIIQIGGAGLPPPALQIVMEPLPGGVDAEPYSQPVRAVGGVPPYTWSIVEGSLPDGLSLDPDTGVISGTPLQPGDFTFTVQVTDSGSPANTNQQELSIAIAPAYQPPALALSDTTVEFPSVCLGADNPPDQTVDVWNGGQGKLYWVATIAGYEPSDAWLMIDRTSGSSTGPEDRTTMTFRADITGLDQEGEYTATVRLINNDRPEEDYKDVTVILRLGLGASTIVVRSNIEADYLLRRVPDGGNRVVGKIAVDTEIPGRTKPTEDPKVFENVHEDVEPGRWQIEWAEQANAWPKKPVTEEKLLPACGSIVFTKDYIMNMPSDVYQLIIEPINYATGIYTARVRIKNMTGGDNPPGRTFIAPIWLVVKEVTFRVSGPNSEGRLWNADGITSAQYPDSGNYRYIDVSDWAPLGPGEISPEAVLQFYIKDRNPNFEPVIEVWANDPVAAVGSGVAVCRVLCQPEGAILLQWESSPGTEAVVEAANTPMGPWLEISSEMICHGGLMEWVDSPPQDVRCRFYRVRTISP